jgi:hypothetical protein
VALAEAAVAGGVGARIEGVADHAALFGESPSRAVLCIAPDAEAAVRERAGRAGVTLRALGPATGDRLVIDGLVDVAVGALTAAWRDCIPFAFEVAWGVTGKGCSQCVVCGRIACRDASATRLGASGGGQAIPIHTPTSAQVLE